MTPIVLTYDGAYAHASAPWLSDRICSLFFTKSLRFGDSLASRMKSTLTELAGGFHDRGRVE